MDPITHDFRKVHRPLKNTRPVTISPLAAANISHHKGKYSNSFSCKVETKMNNLTYLNFPKKIPRPLRHSEKQFLKMQIPGRKFSERHNSERQIPERQIHERQIQRQIPESQIPES